MNKQFAMRFENKFFACDYSRISCDLYYKNYQILND
jgi:hypothetical protein